MIIVTGNVRARPETLDEMLAISLEHVRRSRLEPGCLLHSVHQDVEDPLHVVFVEHWADGDALRAHFELPESLTFVTDASLLAAEPPVLQVFEGEPVSI